MFTGFRVHLFHKMYYLEVSHRAYSLYRVWSLGCLTVLDTLNKLSDSRTPCAVRVVSVVIFFHVASSKEPTIGRILGEV